MSSTRYSCQILTKFKFCDRFLKNTQISNFIKIRPVGGELFRADGQTDMTKVTVVFRNFANAPKNSSCLRSRPLTLVIRIGYRIKYRTVLRLL